MKVYLLFKMEHSFKKKKVCIQNELFKTSLLFIKAK